MANPFYSNNWNPIRHGYYCPQAQIQPTSIKPKRVTIPVQFVRSDDNTSRLMPAVSTEATRAAAAVKIQRVVRGFLVRKNARVVRRVAAEVEEIERRVREEEAKIGMDSRERLRVNEALMALLLRLDSVRGVRDFRKKVIRRVIALQEAVDSIPEAADGAFFMSEAAAESSIESEKAQMEVLKDDYDGAPRPSLMVESSEPATAEGEEGRGMGGEAAEESVIPDHENEADKTLDPEEGKNEAETELEMEIPPAIKSSPKNKSNPTAFQIVDDASRSPVAAEEVVIKDDEEELAEEVVAKGEEGKGMKEVMEKMAEENERLKDMVAELCARSVEQCLLMESLASRVEHLERAVHRIDRRKRRKSGAAACSVLSSAK